MLTKASLQVLAAQRMREAERLIDAALWSGAYYIAGYAAELGLKAVIAGRFRADAIPDRAFVNGVHTHNLAALVSHAQLQPALDAERTRQVGFALNWERVRNWSEDARYRLWAEDEARAMVNALNDPDRGVLEWIRRHW